MELTFRVAGVPKPQPRPKAARIGGFVRIYTPYTKEAKEWRSGVIEVAMSRAPKTLTGPLYLSLCFVLPRPKGHFTKKGLRPKAPAHPTARPDVDNLAKMVMDALGEAGLWADDAQVVSLYVSKSYDAGPNGAATGCEIRISAPV